MGIPVVTLPSDMLGGRLTLSMYRTMGMDQLVAKDVRDYTRIALKVALPPPRPGAAALRRVMRRPCVAARFQPGLSEECGVRD
jgi:predicted O-linked N-acetylglucosamine transferase (SPINDLY family)